MMARKRVAAVQFVLASTLLVLAFYGNAFGVAEADWFRGHQRQVEGQVAARLIVADRHGLFSHSGFNGLCEARIGQHQDELYIDGRPCGRFKPYRSQVGLQATSFALFDRLTPFDRDTTWKLIQLITACFSALFIASLLCVLGAEFGHLAFAAALAATLFSPWMTVFGRLLYWVVGFFYLPLVVVIWLQWREDHRRAAAPVAAAAWIGGAVLLKCLFNGYEYMTTTLFMMVTPLVYLAVARGWSPARLLGRTALYGSAAIAGIMISMVILSFQIGTSHRDGFSGGIRHIVSSYQKRTHADPDNFPKMYRRSLDAGVAEVLSMYLSGTVFGFDRKFDGQHPEKLDPSGRFTYRNLIALYAAATFAALVLALRLPRNDRQATQLRALVITTWFAALAPLSWFVIFKAHSYVHTHVNFLTWHMPFVPIGAALCGLLISIAITRRSELTPQ